MNRKYLNTALLPMSSVFFCKKTNTDLTILFDIDFFHKMLFAFDYKTRQALDIPSITSSGINHFML